VTGPGTTLLVPPTEMDLATAARILREATRDKSYRAYPIGAEAGAYLRWKRGQIAENTYYMYESLLDKVARNFCDLELTDLEPPIGTERMEEFLDSYAGDKAPATYNTYHAILRDFFKWAVIKGKLHGDPMLPIPRRKKRDAHRTIFSEEARARIYADGPDEDWLYRDKVALRLLLKYGLRKGAMLNIQYKHFDRSRRRLTVFTKGSKVRELPIVDDSLWEDLGNHMALLGAEPSHYLMCRRKYMWRGYHPQTGESKFEWVRYPDKAMSSHGMHDWWYGCLQRAGLVPTGITSGERMHKARHTAGQVLLDKHGNIKAVQKLLMHADPSTTLAIYTDWDLDRLAVDLEGLE
jgi:integrase